MLPSHARRRCDGPCEWVAFRVRVRMSTHACRVMRAGASPQVALPLLSHFEHRTVRHGTHGDPSRRRRTRKRTHGCPRHGLLVQVRPYRAAGATRGSGLRRSAERQRERHAIRRRDVSRDTELETIPGVSQHHSLANDRKSLAS